jgi:hypothetical protein
MAVDIRILKKLKQREKELDFELKDMEERGSVKPQPARSGGVTISTHRSGLFRPPPHGQQNKTTSEMMSRKYSMKERNSKSNV